jgi:hypothetical protein
MILPNFEYYSLHEYPPNHAHSALFSNTRQEHDMTDSRSNSRLVAFTLEQATGYVRGR